MDKGLTFIYLSKVVLHSHGNEVEMLALDWVWHSKMSHITRLKSNRFILIQTVTQPGFEPGSLEL